MFWDTIGLLPVLRTGLLRHNEPQRPCSRIIRLNQSWPTECGAVGLAAIPKHRDNRTVRNLGRLLPIRLGGPKRWTREWMAGCPSDTAKTTRRRRQHRDGLSLYFANRATRPSRFKMYCCRSFPSVSLEISECRRPVSGPSERSDSTERSDLAERSDSANPSPPGWLFLPSREIGTRRIRTICCLSSNMSKRQMSSRISCCWFFGTERGDAMDQNPNELMTVH